jgi:hypothetical protein
MFLEEYAWHAVKSGAVCFCLAAVISFAPMVGRASGVVTLGVYVIGVGLLYLTRGLGQERSFLTVLYIRLGLTILGGFLGAIAIFALSFVIRALN